MTEQRTSGLLAGDADGRRTQRRERALAASSRGSSRRWQRPQRPDGKRARAGAREPAEKVSIELSQAQVDQIVRAAGQGGAMSVLLSALNDPSSSLGVDSQQEWSFPAQMEDRRLSRSLLSGLLVLSCFPVDGGYLGIAELARLLGMNTSTTHRYVSTLLAVGLLERDAATRRYRLASS
ncbi:MAG TPA: helix-turn-helix domain-containing protein [Solirubrobacteraceae bacterium]|nr:helix-turn-helix domain-containing protein [Solirubrobacteraceae bacterium]